MVATVEYVWIGGSVETSEWSLRSKTKVLPGAEQVVLDDLPPWNYDGSSTKQASGGDSEVIIKPCALFVHPFRENGYIVMCDTYSNDMPLPDNHRATALQIFNAGLEREPWFGLEQEYFLINPMTKKPLGFTPKPRPSRGGKHIGWNKDRSPECTAPPQGQYYCSVGAENSFGRKIAEQHLTACIKAGITISGINAEVAPGQWEFQIGPCTGIDSGDHMWVARYLLLLIAEEHNVIVDFNPKPVPGDWNGSGCHANYSTKAMREDDNGLELIHLAVNRLSEKHDEHMAVYGKDNHKRMTGQHETADYKIFNSGIADRGASVRIGRETAANGKGYFEDRRPSSNCDPYLVTGMIESTCRGEQVLGESV